MKPLISILLEQHLEREAQVRRQNQFAERKAIERWELTKRKRKQDSSEQIISAPLTPNPNP